LSAIRCDRLTRLMMLADATVIVSPRFRLRACLLTKADGTSFLSLIWEGCFLLFPRLSDWRDTRFLVRRVNPAVFTYLGGSINRL
jgi:hypothetical protein